METKQIVEKVKPPVKECDSCKWFSCGQAVDKNNTPVFNDIGAPTIWKDCSKSWGPKNAPFLGVIKNTCGIHIAK